MAADKPQSQIRDFIYNNMTSEQAHKQLGFSRKELLNHVVAAMQRPRTTPKEVDTESDSAGSSKDGGEQDPTSRADSPPAPSGATNSPLNEDRSEKGPERITLDSDHSGDSLSASSDEAEALPGLDLEFASVNIPQLRGMILEKKSFKALRRLIYADTQPRKAMSTAKMHLPSKLARADKTLESCVDQAYLAIAALEGGQTEVARVLLNNMAANLELERRKAIAEALGVEDSASDISRDGRTDLFSPEERQSLPSFRDKQKTRKSKPGKTKAKANADRSFRPSTDSKNGRKPSGGDQKGDRHQPRE